MLLLKRNTYARNAGTFLKGRIQRLTMRQIVSLLCVIVFFISATMFLFYQFFLPWQADTKNAEARSLYQSSSQVPSSPPVRSSSPSETGKAETSPSSLSKLQKINPDVTGWIQLPDTEIDYPVLLAPKGAPDYYLSHDWLKSTTKYGSIFMLQPDLPPLGRKNSILYGHSMKDGRMFAALLKYESLSFYRSHPVVMFQQNSQKVYWKIFAVIKVNTEASQGPVFDYQKSLFSSEKDFLAYLYQIKIRSLFNLPVTLIPSDSIMTLSTCSYEFSGFRTVLFARRVREYESVDVNTSKAEKNPNPLYPDCWYQRFGGTKPNFPSFEKATKDNSPPWLIESP